VPAGPLTPRETQGGRGNFEFDYQVVARVRGQERTRLEAFTPPSLAPDSIRSDSVRPDTVRPDPGRATPAQELPTEAPR
jgi:hypothetical protein